MNDAYEPPPPHYKIGDYVVLKRGEGFVRYIGRREHHHGTWYGIELTVGEGPNDGTEHGKRYFTCKPRHGAFVREYTIKHRVDTTSATRPRPVIRKHLPALPQSTTVSENNDTSTTSSPSSYHHGHHYHHQPPPPFQQHQHQQQHQPPLVRPHRMTASSLSSSSSSRAPPPVHSHYTLTMNRHLLPRDSAGTGAKSPRSRSPRVPFLAGWTKSAPRPQSTRAVSAAEIDGKATSSKHRHSKNSKHDRHSKNSRNSKLSSRSKRTRSSRHLDNAREQEVVAIPVSRKSKSNSSLHSPSAKNVTSRSPKTPSLTPTVKSSPRNANANANVHMNGEMLAMMYTNPRPGHFKTDTVEIVDHDEDDDENCLHYKTNSMASMSMESSAVDVVFDGDMDDDINDENENETQQLQHSTVSTTGSRRTKPSRSTRAGGEIDNNSSSQRVRQRAHRESRPFFPSNVNASYVEGDDADRVVLPMARATTISVTEQIASVSNPRSRHHSRHSVDRQQQQQHKKDKKRPKPKKAKKTKAKKSKNSHNHNSHSNSNKYRCRSKSRPDPDANYVSREHKHHPPPYAPAQGPPLRYYYQQQHQQHPQKVEHPHAQPHMHGRRRTDIAGGLALRHSETETDLAPRIYRKQTQQSDGSTPPLPPPTQRAHSSQSPRDNPNMNEAEKLREIDRVKQCTLQRHRRDTFHKRQSRTVDFAFCENRELDEFARVRRTVAHNDSETSDSDSDDDSSDSDSDDVMKDIQTRQKERELKQQQFQLPPLNRPQSPGKYTFRVRIKNTPAGTTTTSASSSKRISQRKSEPETYHHHQHKHDRPRKYDLVTGKGCDVDEDVVPVVRNEYAVQLPHHSSPVPLQVKQSYSISRSAAAETEEKCGATPHLSLEIHDSNEEEEQADTVAIVGYGGGTLPSQSQKRSNASSNASASSNVMINYDPNEHVAALHLPHDSLAQIEQNKQGLLHKQNRWNLDLLPDESDSENIASNSQSKKLFLDEKRTVSNASSSKHSRRSKQSKRSTATGASGGANGDANRSLLAVALQKSKSKSRSKSKSKREQQDREDMKVDTVHCGDDILFIAQNNKPPSSSSMTAGAQVPPPLEQPLFEIEDSVIEYHVPSRAKKKKSQNIKINIHINNDIVNNKKKKGGSKSGSSRNLNKCVKASSSNSPQQHAHAHALHPSGKGHKYSRSSMNGCDDTIKLQLALSPSPAPQTTTHEKKKQKKKKKKKKRVKLKHSESQQTFYDNDNDKDDGGAKNGSGRSHHRPLSARASNEHQHHHHHAFEITRDKSSKHNRPAAAATVAKSKTSSKRCCTCQKHKRREERDKLTDECVVPSPRNKHHKSCKKEKKCKQQQQHQHQPQQIKFRSKTTKCLTPKPAASYARPQFV
eukprot:CAMPEP_0202692398 /NCGR_PEP_ID=MMETSP1385-20130828/6786_1 /ASSEMBLY_ACC=CAM_ASM_000861 /TAXON_ID=933848 /ORGANISM="Elphidium margaritaceum" /LENGTH=1378 /DNA_ID=CAMNT_0049347925 /DNA_START=30 /DNA_END=4166 /DNA_ORIENTATION=-